MRTKVLITGANGFVGSQLKKYLKNDYQLSFLTRTPKGNNEYLIPTPQNGQVAQLLRVIRPDIIIHLAAIAHTSNSKSDLDKYEKINHLITKALATAAAKLNIKLIFLSSIKIFGDLTPEIITSSTKPAPSDAYSISKLNAEKSILELHRKKNLNYTIIRPTLVYGQNPKGNLKTLISYSKTWLPNIFPKNSPKRQMTSLDTLIKIIRLSIKGNENKILNVADEQGYNPYDIVNCYRKKNKILSLYFPIPLKLWKMFFFFTFRRKYYNKIFSQLKVDISYIKNALK